MGKIGHAENEAIKSAKADAPEGKKKDKKSVYLPPSFMEATLLSGLIVPTSEGAHGNPIPAIIRIKAPAQLPNEVRGNLKGCFVIAEAVASLADERASLRLVNLSCISKNGQAVIDQEITGFVQDGDGNIGLSGKVVSKFGAVIARSMLAGFFEGVGNAVSASASTTSVSPLGQTQALNTSSLKNIGVAGFGSGIASAAKEVQKFYLELAKNSLPVVEVLNGKKITLVVSKGVNLEIKNYKIVPWY